MNTWDIVEHRLRMEPVPNAKPAVCPYCGNEFQARARVAETKTYRGKDGLAKRVRLVTYPDTCSRLCARLLRDEKKEAALCPGN